MGKGLAVITGGSKGIGRALAFELASEGYSLVLNARTESELANTQKEILKVHPNIDVQYVPGSISEEKTHDRIEQEVNHYRDGELVLVNNAGIFDLIPSINEQFGSADRNKHIAYARLAGAMMDVTKGHLMLTQRLVPSLMERNGTVADVLSAAVVTKYTNNFGYAAAKRAQWENSLDVAVNSQGKIDTVRIFPSNTETDMRKNYNGPKLKDATVAEALANMIGGVWYTDLYMEQLDSTTPPFSAGFYFDGAEMKGKHFDSDVFMQRYSREFERRIRDRVRLAHASRTASQTESQ